MNIYSYILTGLILAFSIGDSFSQDRLSQREKGYILLGQVNKEWLVRNNIELNKLPKADPSTLRYLCDSSLILKEEVGDTIKIWFNRTGVPVDTIQIFNKLNSPLYGKSLYIKGIHEQGKILAVRLHPLTFLVRNDSLFQLDTFNKLTPDSIRKIYSVPVDKFQEAYDKIIKPNQYKEFKLIYHPKIFQDGDFTHNRKGDIIRLASVWELDGVNYYEIQFISPYEPYGVKRRYIFDENFRFLNLEGCFDDILIRLTEENKITKNR
ncbi:MAG: hypothetical protein HRT58_09780 [Crocinitomicaceae bacterium]|nr:hypothetical protein [Flavobacteriales bacterium]NQZ35945.1 hypothetical protein [Crocinitomicaceae bacterium]